MKWKGVVDLDDSMWLCDVAVTVDVSALSLKMNSFKAKWKWWRVHLERKNTETFPPRTKACHDASFHGGVCKTPSSILQNVTGHEIKTKATEHVCYVGPRGTSWQPTDSNLENRLWGATTWLPDFREAPPADTQRSVWYMCAVIWAPFPLSGPVRFGTAWNAFFAFHCKRGNTLL